MDDDSLTMQQWTAHDGQLTKTAWRWSGGLLIDVAMDNRNGQLGKWTAWQWTACDGQLGAIYHLALDGLAMDSYGLAIKCWTARQCHNGGLGNVAMDSSRWMTACNRRLSDKALDSLAMDGLAMDGLAIKHWMARR
jgi:hypothetical protein